MPAASTSLRRRVSPARFYLPGSEEVFGKEAPRNKKYIFVVMPNACNMPLFWGFGLHGGRFAPQIRLRYLLPRVLFYVPLLRDALMWTGAVAMRSHNPSESGESTTVSPRLVSWRSRSVRTWLISPT